MLWLISIGLIIVVAHLHSKVNRLEGMILDGVPAQQPAYEEYVAPEAPWTSAPPPEAVATHDLVFATPEPRPVEAPLPAEPDVANLPDQQSSVFPSSDVDQAAAPKRSGFSFEDLFGRRLPIWAGGITLAVAGVLIVKLSIEAGLISPIVRVISGALFGLLLIVGAEFAYRFEHKVRDVRVRQALAGAGIASLYASCLLAANLYHLIGATPAMLGMAAVTALAMLLAVRFGAPSALLGLLGGLSAPALIGSAEPNVPLLSLYLALAIGGLCTLSRSQKWMWLGASALVGGFGWGLLLVVGGALDLSSSVSVAMLLLLLGIVFPAFAFAGDQRNLLRLGSGVVAAAQVAALVSTGGFAMLNWGLFAMISVAMVWLADRDSTLRPAAAVGALIALLLMAVWPTPPVGSFAIVFGGAVLIYGAPALRRLWSTSGSLLEAGQIVALTLGGFLIALLQFQELPSSSHPLGWLAAGLAIAASGSALLGWRNASRSDDARFALLLSAAAFLLCASVTLLLAHWVVGIGIGVIGLALLLTGHRAEDRRLEPVAWLIALVGLGAFMVGLFDSGTRTIDVLRWSLIAGLAALFAWRGRVAVAPAVAQFGAPLLAFGAWALLVPDAGQPAVAGGTLVALGWWAARLDHQRLLPAMSGTALIIVAWGLEPLGQWIASGAQSLMASPMLVHDVPDMEQALTRLLIPGLLVMAAAYVARNGLGFIARWSALAAGGLFSAIALHSLYKQIFGIVTADMFVSLGLAERLVWEFALIGLAALLWKLRQHRAALVPAVVAAAHWTVYSLLLHNPLWAEQSVGALLMVNLIVPLYAVPLLLWFGLKQFDQVRELVPERVLGVAGMVLILLFVASMLRQLFHGSLLVAPGLSQAEDIARSMVAITLAIGFLLWGIRNGRREWRIGSLVLMLGAVCKVFLWDASGLNGMVRIASFVALGFSLIGIGWLYARHLGPQESSGKLGQAS